MNRAIKRISAAFFTFLSGITALFGIFCSTACTGSHHSEELFFYRTETVEANIVMECNGTSSSFHYKGNEEACTVEFTAPNELNGFILEVSSDSARVIYEDLNTEAPEALCTIPNIVRRIFALSPENVTEITTAPHPQNEEETVTVVTVSEITVTLDQSGSPIIAEGTLFGTSFRAQIIDLAVIRQE